MMTFKRSERTWPPMGGYREVKTEDGKRSARITCPHCGLRGSLAETHEIGPDGLVTPSVMCPGNGQEVCTFHETVTLEGWRAEE